MIELKQALREIDRKDYRDGNGTFSIMFMLLDVKRNTGGELLELKNAAKCALPPNCKAHEMRGIKDLDTGKAYPVHNRLMFKFDNQPIYWV